MFTIVLATGKPGARPGDVLAGLTLALRSVLSAQKAGATRIVLVVDSADVALAEATRGDRRIRVPLDVVTPRRGAAELLTAAESAPPNSDVIVTRHDVCFDPVLYRALFSEAARDTLGAVSRGKSGAAGEPLCAGPLRASIEGLRALAEHGDLDAGIERLVADGRLRAIDLPNWAERLNDASGRQRAFEQLFEACRKSVDGFVARHLNRHISLFLSKRLVSTPITPNMVSGVTLVLGMLAGVSVARGGYLPILIGATLWQLNSVLDGVDGELARVRFEHSRLGQWLDTISDDLSNIVFWAALGIGASALPQGRWLSLAGWIAAGGNFGLAATYYAQMIAMGSGDVYDIIGAPKRADAVGLRGRIDTVLRYVSKKDFFVFFCWVLAVFGVLPYALPVFAAFGVGAFVAALFGALKRIGVRRTA